ncbi:MAG: cobalamin biosynthesis protein CbiB, partial [Polaromonas sp.]
IDFVPARVTSLGFAVVGSFEDAIDAWRNYTQRFSAGVPVTLEARNDGIILAATSGAVNVRLGGETLKAATAGPLGVDVSQGFQTAGSGSGFDAEASVATESTPGREPEIAHLRSIVGLVWRSVVLWTVLLALLTLARLLG